MNWISNMRMNCHQIVFRTRFNTFTLLVVLSAVALGCARSKPPGSSKPAKATVESTQTPKAAAAPNQLPESNSPPQEKETQKKPQTRALLIGCTIYDSMPPDKALRGPGNDVALMRQLLLDRYGVQNESIKTLVEGKSPGDRPTKNNIVRELVQLAASAEKGDKVVILLSGHGSQQLDADYDDKEDPEPDGLDEIFCPADICKATDPDNPYPVNALTDDELRSAIKAIRSKGAFVWIIVDACHSGSAVRGNEVYRQISPEDLVSSKAFAQNRPRARGQTRGLIAVDSAMDKVDEQGGLVAIYAAQSHEPTLELPLPRGAEKAEWRGLLTYTMIKVLTSSSEPLTYRELVHRIHNEYTQAYGRLGPTPLIEGIDQQQLVLSDSAVKGRSQLFVTRDQKNQLSINAGRLHGFDKGTVFAVYSPPGEAHQDVPLGYVRSERSGLTSLIVEPIKYRDVEPRPDLPAGGRCEPVEVQYERMALHVSIDVEGGENSSTARGKLVELIGSLETDPGLRIQVNDDLTQADWIVRNTASGQLFLVPSEGWTKSPEETYFGPAPTDRLSEWLRERLSRISRVKTLLKLCDASQRGRTSIWSALVGAKKSCDIELVMLEQTDKGEIQPINWTDRGWKLKNGEQFTLVVKNTGNSAIDFTVMFIDSKAGITQLFPTAGSVSDNRLVPGQANTVGPLEVEATSLGMEHLVVIAAKAEGQPMDFSWLGQDALEQAPQAARSGQGPDLLGEFFRQALHSRQTIRGMKVSDSDNICLRAISWQTTKD